MSSPVPQQVFLPSEGLAAVQTVVRSLRFNAHVELEVSVEMLPPAVGLGAALVGAVEQPLLGVGVVSPGPGVRSSCVVVSPWSRPMLSVGVEGGQHCHRDRTVSVPCSPHLGVKTTSARNTGPVEILLMPREVFLPLEIFTTNSTEEWSLGLLTEMGDL